jgi:hypothetical protein
MREHGITTTAADYWVHLFPYSYEVYWYRVEHCLEYIDRKNAPIRLGKSADGVATGNGYLIPKGAYFVRCQSVPARYIDHENWHDATDRQFGFMGEAVVSVLVEHAIIKFPAARPFALRSKKAQFEASDAEVKWLHPLRFETKTERLSDTANLYVQTHEGGHRVHQLRGHEQVAERVTAAPKLSDDEPSLF